MSQWVQCKKCRRQMLHMQDYPAYQCSECGLKVSYQLAHAHAAGDTHELFQVMYFREEPKPPEPRDESLAGGLSVMSDLAGAVGVVE